MGLFRNTRTTKQFPNDNDGNGWFNILDNRPKFPRVEDDHKFDWVVIGAGVSGLASAREIANTYPEASIALVDAQPIGFGPSGRNAGFVVTHHICYPLKNFEMTHRKIRLATAGTQYLREVVRDHQIRCEWSDWGRTYTSYNDESEDQLNGMRGDYERLGIETQDVSSATLQEQTGIDFYRSGVHFSDSALVNPSAMCVGLASTMPPNVHVFESSPVLNTRIGPPSGIGFAEGHISTENVVLCTSTFTSQLGFNSPTVPIGVFASLSEPVDPVGPDGQILREFGIMEVLDTGATLRLTRDKRLYVRGGYYTYGKTRSPSAKDLEFARELHRQDILKRYPHLSKSLQLTHTWSGYIGFSRNDAHLFGKLGDGLYANVPYDSSPLSRGSLAGKLLADDIAGRESDSLLAQKELPKPAWLPPEPILGAIVKRKLNKAMSSAGVHPPR